MMTPKQLYEANLKGVSYTDLGRKLGVSRSTISGRVNKYRISIGGVTATEYKAGKRNGANIHVLPTIKKPVQKSNIVKIDKTKSYPHAVAPKIKIKDLDGWGTASTCRFLGSDYKIEAYEFCSDERVPHSSYCAKHHELTHRQTRKKNGTCTDNELCTKRITALQINQ